MKTIYSIGLLLIVGGCFIGEELPADQDVWNYRLPSEVGMVDTVLLNLDGAIIGGNFDPVRSMIIVKDDNIVFENYYNGDTRSTLHNLGRSTPLITVLALGIALNEGIIADIDEEIHDLLPVQYRTMLAGEKRRITLRHLLTHTGGFSWNETVLSNGLNAPANNLNMMRAAADPIEYLITQPLEAVPGVRFNFNTGTSALIARIVASAAGESFDTYVLERIFKPLGISDYQWRRDGLGDIDGATGLWLSTLDLTKIGYLYLNEGSWRGREIVSPEWIQDAGTTQLEISNSFNYGYYWQKFSDNIRFVPLFPINDAYFFSQHIYVHPSQNLLITFGTEDVFLNLVSSPFLLYREVISPIAF